MTQNRWRSLAEAVAAAGVILSLVFVGFQIRQNTISARAQAYQEIGITMAQFFQDDWMNPELLGIRQRSLDSLTVVELEQVRAFVLARLRLWETLFLNVEAGALPASAMNQMGTWTNICEPVRGEWSYYGSRVGADFREYLTEVCDLAS